MADSGPSAEKHKKPTTSFFSSPRLFTSKVLYETEAMMSPTSILDSKPFSAFKNPFWSETNSPRTTVGEHKRYWDRLDSKGLVDALVDEKPADFSAKMRNSRLGKSAFGSANSALETSKSRTRRVSTGCLSATEMELSEDYTRVISHGPNPKTTHIFDNCVVEGSCFHVGCTSSAIENVFPSETFMSFCFYCNKNLGQGIDIYIYRGERAFCSSECRYQGMLLEENGT
ncbi:Zf-FLZ domain [Sesbania bispinosa]|nr:Zf-FLZ domain [Sesbania bispinosa]